MLCWRYSPMPRRSIRSIAGLQRACNASNRRSARLYKKPYILKDALSRHLARFDELDRIADPADRFEAFRHIPAFEYDLEGVHASLTPRQRQSLAQQDRAKHPRVRLTRHRQARIESGAVLRDLIFDDRGNRMSPTYTMRRGSRYRYYVSQAQLRGNREGSRPRIGADDVERLIVEQLCRRQRRDGLAADITNGVWSAETRELIPTMVDRVIVHHDEIEVALKIKGEGGTAASIDGEDKNESQKTFGLPLPPSRPRERKEIFIPGNSGTQPRRIDQALILALARARSWMRALQLAEFVDTAEIAQRFGLSDAHVRRLLRLSYLAPDIVEAIVEGRQPRILTVKLLLRAIPLVTAPASPWQNGYAERLIGSIRRECLDYFIVLGEVHLRRILRAYCRYYNRSE